MSIYDDGANDSCGNCTNYQDYDRDESFSVYFLEELVPVALVYGVTLVVGLVGNLLIIYTVVSFRRMRTISNVFLASLATADLLVVCVCVPVKFIQLFSYSWTLGEFCCKFVHYFQNVSAICSVLTLTSMSVERYYAIMHPVKSRYQCTMSQARRVIIIIWIASFVTAIPIIFAQIHLEVGERYRAYWCVRNWHQPWVWRAYEVYMLLLLLVVPSLVMGFAYCSICHQLWIVVKDRANMSCGEIRGEPTGASYWCKSLLVRAQLAPSLGMACLRSVHAALAAGGALTGYGVRLLLHLPPAVDCGQGSGQHDLWRDTYPK
ncbi:hypothetical protein JTE90_003540 [Oedothorax gibbosus]|uniref:G-protein coupled receptors family 1 profile domain-containing protein n=1 Tax=Oedothorax gibbosus TaxID=931172 RepID=A0AAV6UP02_9ARAC|nr:hypothetical protein JTE90_003540 [Oedothorax gibbosus]